MSFSPSNDERTHQIIQYLCSIRAFVVDCCCEFPAPTTNGQNTSGTAPPAGSLLTSLQVTFPGTNWSDVNILVQSLLEGARRGRFKRLTTTSGDEFWYIDLFMIKKNYSNKRFRSSCSAIKDCGPMERQRPNF